MCETEKRQKCVILASGKRLVSQTEVGVGDVSHLQPHREENNVKHIIHLEQYVFFHVCNICRPSLLSFVCVSPCAHFCGTKMPPLFKECLCFTRGVLYSRAEEEWEEKTGSGKAGMWSARQTEYTNTRNCVTHQKLEHANTFILLLLDGHLKKSGLQAFYIGYFFEGEVVLRWNHDHDTHKKQHTKQKHNPTFAH